jgi:hypothetical protein
MRRAKLVEASNATMEEIRESSIAPTKNSKTN